MSPRPLHAIPARHELRYTERFSEESLTRWRSEGDPLADECVTLLAAERPIRSYSNLLGEVRTRAADDGGVFRQLVEHCETVPPWADFGAMATGQRILAAFPLHMGLSLFAGSLCGGAVFQKMSLVTAMTGMLSGDSNRRLDETAAMVLRMALPGTLPPGGDAHELLMRVRLLHAALRHHLTQTGRFQHPTEVPINQQDLAITLGLFGYVNLRSLAAMGIRLRRHERDSFILMWRYAGHVLGIDPALLPVTMEDQREFFLASLRHQGRPEALKPGTKVVMDNLAREASQVLPGVSFELAQEFLHQSCRWLTGNEYVSGMQIEDAGDNFWGIRLLKGLGAASHVTWHYLPRGRRALYAMGAGNYRRSLRRMGKTRDQQGEYRVRTAQTAVRTGRSAA